MKHGCGEEARNVAYVIAKPLEPPMARSRFNVYFCPRCDKLFWRRKR